MGRCLGRVCRLAPDDPDVFSPVQGKWLYGCKGLLDVTCFRRAAARLLARHEGLRAEMESPAGRLAMLGGVGCQFVSSHPADGIWWLLAKHRYYRLLGTCHVHVTCPHHTTHCTGLIHYSF